jgi:predicted nucleic acid-binding protein
VTPSLVADASVAIGWIHRSQATPLTDALLDAIGDGTLLEVPALFPLEVANALTVLARRRKLTADERTTALGWLRGLTFRVDHEASALALSTLAGLADRYTISVYDASYLELAQRRQLPLACKDGPLRTAATEAAVKLWRPPS